jgi:hypothetical protein
MEMYSVGIQLFKGTRREVQLGKTARKINSLMGVWFLEFIIGILLIIGGAEANPIPQIEKMNETWIGHVKTMRRR